MKKDLLLILVMLVFLKSPVYAQSYNMTTGSITACGGIFYDNGGASGNYSNNQILTYTICTSQPLNQLVITFTSFNLESGNDFLYIHNGANSSAPLLGMYTGTVNPGIFTSANGCLTFVFISNSSITAPGWAANISCNSTAPPPCSTSGCPPGSLPPLNDACSNATNLGALPSPAACPNGTGATIGVAGTTSCANAENPFMQQQGCLTGNNMPAPAADVWYTFTITGSVLNVQIQGMNSPSAAIWQGSNCGNLIGRGCARGSGGNLNANFQGLAPGQYYLQISGGSMTDQCNFTLLLKNNTDCNTCLISSNIVATPPPVNGSYQPGQTVTFCLTVNAFNQTSNNWLHGVVPQFGSGWNLSTLTNLQAANSCSGQGTWSWYNTPVTSSATGTTAGPGFFFESWLGSPLGVADNNPGNNYGDNNSGSCTWTFCWTITAKNNLTCNQNSNLTIDVNTYGDGETGSWTSLACTTDPLATSIATLQCCSIPNVTFTSPSCSAGGSNGTATGTGQGTGPWTYAWYIGNIMFQTTSNKSGPETITGLIPGNYTFKTIDPNGCESSAYFTISAPTALNLSINSTNAACGVNNGTASANVIGGSGPYTYLWSTGATTSSINNLGPGPITVTAIDANGCSVMSTTTITQPVAPVLNITSTNVNCFGGTNGTASVSPVGGTAPYNYVWSNTHTTSSINNLSANTYVVTVTDANGCNVTSSTTVSQPTTGIAATVNVISLSSCNSSSGSANVAVSGGTAPYFYNWSNGSTGNSATGLNTGNISVTVTDILGCSVTANGNIGMVLAPSATISSFTNPGCFGDSNGNATVNVVGGSSPYTYQWSSGDDMPTATNLSAGNYAVTVTDAAGCTATAIATLSQPSPLTLNLISKTDVSCYGASDGSATISATGGNGNFSYQWSSGSVSAVAQGLSGLEYTITVTDMNGCTSTSSVTILEPSELTATILSENATCNGFADGSAQVIPAGGISPYQFTWSSGSTTSSVTNLLTGSYFITVTDANGCTSLNSVNISEPSAVILSPVSDFVGCVGEELMITAQATGGTGNINYIWSNGVNAATNNIFINGNQIYSVQAFDSIGCSSSVETFTVDEYPDLTVVIPSISTVCSGTSVNLVPSVSGGDGSYLYNWNTGETSSSINVSPISTSTYSISVTDGCGTNVNEIIQVPVETLSNLSFTPDQTESCGPSEISFTQNSSVPVGSIFHWDFGDNTTQIHPFPVKRYEYPGTYSVTMTVTSPIGCTSSVSISDLITIYPLPEAAFTYSPSTEISTLNAKVSFLDLSKNCDSWSWDFGDGIGRSILKSPVYNYSQFGEYKVKLVVENTYGCTDTAVQIIKIKENFAVFFPNTFTPDGDGLNDYFYAFGEGIQSMEMKVFDRWGKLVFETENKQLPWNGKMNNSGEELPMGVYVYSVIVTDQNGSYHSFNGLINLYR